MKELKGQFKTDFEKWYINKYHRHLDFPNRIHRSLGDYYRQPIEMQFGVVQLFADSVSVDLYIKPRGLNKSVYLDDVGHHIIFDYLEFDTYPEAQQEAIIQFEKWYNETNLQNTNNKRTN